MCNALANRTVRATAHCRSAFRPAVCTRHGIEKVLRVTTPLKVFHGEKDTVQRGGWAREGDGDWGVYPPPLVLATPKSQINTVPTPTVAWTRA